MGIITLALLVLMGAGCAPSAEAGTIGWIRNAPSRRALPSTVAAVRQPLAAADLATDDEVALSEAQLRQAGAELYAINCAPCHRLNGEGNLGRFPSLNNSPLVFGQVPTPLINTVLYGRGEMPAFSPTLSDLQMAALLTYVRQAWDNQAPAVTPAQIQTVRQARAP